MKKHPILSALLVLVLVVIVSNHLSTRAYENSFKGKSPIGIDGAPQPTEPRYTVVNRCAERFVSQFPNQSRTEYDTETNTFSLYFFDYTMATVAARMMDGNAAYIGSWSEIRSFVAEQSATIQQMCDSAGYSDIDVIVYMVYPADINLYYLSASRGNIIFDAMDKINFIQEGAK